MRSRGSLKALLLLLVVVWCDLEASADAGVINAQDASFVSNRTCLTSPNTPAPADNPLSGEQTLVQQPVSYDLLCATYFARCMSGGSCSDAELEAGKWKWVYGSLTDFECKELQGEDMEEEFKFVTCCSGSNCNVPDVELDTESHVGTDVKLERADSEQQQQQQLTDSGASSDAVVSGNSTAAATVVNSSSSAPAAGSTADAAQTAKPNAPKQPQQQHPSTSHSAADNKQHKQTQQAQPLSPQQKQHQLQKQKQKQLAKQQQQLAKQRQQLIQQQRQRQAQQIQKQRQHQLQKQQLQKQQQHQQQQRSKPKHIATGSIVPTLTCLRTVPRTRDLSPAVAPKLYRKADGADMCARYKFRCAKNDKTCTAAEIRSKAWKWAYMPLTTSLCHELKDFANKRDTFVKNVLCCSKTNCNRPSPALDPHTKVITNDAAAVSLAQVMAVRAANSAAARSAVRAAAAGGRGGQGSHSSSSSSHHNRARSFAVGRHQQAQWRRESAAAALHETTPVTAAAAVVNTAAKLNITAAEDNAAKLNTTAAVVKDVRAKTNAIAASPKGTAAKKPGPPKTNPAKTNTTAAPNTTAVHKPASTKVRMPRVSCFTSMPRSSSSTKRVSVMQRTYRRTSAGISMCGRYQLHCSSSGRNAACTDAEIDSGAWIWEYRPLTAAVCSEMKAIAALGAGSGFKNVMCCRATGCNKPDRAVDRFTKVRQRPLRASRAHRAGKGKAVSADAAAPAAVAAPVSNSTIA